MWRYAAGESGRAEVNDGKISNLDITSYRNIETGRFSLLRLFCYAECIYAMVEKISEGGFSIPVYFKSVEKIGTREV